MRGIEVIRRHHDMSLADLAKQLNISKQVISGWERGERGIPEKHLANLSSMFSVDRAVFEQELNGLEKLQLQATLIRNEISESVCQIEETIIHEGKEVISSFQYVDPELESELRVANTNTKKSELLSKIGSRIKAYEYDYTDTEQADTFMKLFDRFADIVFADASNIPFLFKVIRAIELHMDVNIREYGIFGRGDEKRGRISDKDVMVVQLFELFNKKEGEGLQEEMRRMCVEHMKQHGSSQVFLSKQLKITPASFSLWLNGHRNLAPHRLAKLQEIIN